MTYVNEAVTISLQPRGASSLNMHAFLRSKSNNIENGLWILRVLYSLTCNEYWCLVYRPIVHIRRIHHAMERCVVLMKETVTHYSESRLRSSFPLDVMLGLLHFL